MPTKMPSDVYWEFMFSSPFLGTFFQYGVALYKASVIIAFSSPFSGTFFQSDLYYCGYCDAQYMFSSPFSGTFFQWHTTKQRHCLTQVFVPFLGDFLSIGYHYGGVGGNGKESFRPLSWGLSFNL